MEAGRVAAVADMFVNCMFAADSDRVSNKARLRCKNGSAAFLAIKAMAHGNAHRFASANGGKLTAAAGGCAGSGQLNFSFQGEMLFFL